MRLDSALTELIQQDLLDSDTEPWLPSLTASLVEQAEREQLAPVGLSLPTYGTQRIVARDAAAPRNSLAQIPLRDGRSLLIEELCSHTQADYEKRGLPLVSRENYGPAIANKIAEALAALRELPSLETSVLALIRSVHLLDVDNDSFDVSHSDPEIPLSVFLSVPNLTTPDVALRVLESLVHEAMHLQLSLIERVTALAPDTRRCLPSPWRSDLRPPTGLLHGSYVFTVIAWAYSRLLSTKHQSVESQSYLSRRLSTVITELDFAWWHLRPDFLTATGRLVLAHLQRARRGLNGI